MVRAGLGTDGPRLVVETSRRTVDRRGGRGPTRDPKSKERRREDVTGTSKRKRGLLANGQLLFCELPGSCP